MAMGPFKTLSANYFQLGIGNDSTCDNAVYVRVTNINSTGTYDLKIRDVANDNSSTTGWTIIAGGESLILKKEPAQFVHASNGNVYASPISPRE